MKFDTVHVFSSRDYPTENVWLDWWAGDGPWISWINGTSIQESLTKNLVQQRI